MSLHTEPQRQHHFMAPTVTEITFDRFDHTDPLFMCVHKAADDAMVEALHEDLTVDLFMQDLIDDVDADGLAYGG